MPLSQVRCLWSLHLHSTANPVGAVIADVMFNFDVALVRCVEHVG